MLTVGALSDPMQLLIFIVHWVQDRQGHVINTLLDAATACPCCQRVRRLSHAGVTALHLLPARMTVAAPTNELLLAGYGCITSAWDGGAVAPCDAETSRQRYSVSSVVHTSLIRSFRETEGCLFSDADGLVDQNEAQTEEA